MPLCRCDSRNISGEQANPFTNRYNIPVTIDFAIHPSAPGAGNGNSNTYTERRVVRLFLGHAESPLWAAGGPISYEDSHLSSQLIEDLRSWEASFYGGGARGSDVVASGQELGRRLASELGHRFVVSVDRMEGVPEMIRVKKLLRFQRRRRHLPRGSSRNKSRPSGFLAESGSFTRPILGRDSRATTPLPASDVACDMRVIMSSKSLRISSDESPVPSPAQF